MGSLAAPPRWPRASWVLAYFSAYLGYLWVVQESELAHWASLVIVPWLLLWWVTRREDPRMRVRDVGLRIGLTWPTRNRGLGIALALVLLVQIVQFLNGMQRQQVLETLMTGRVLWIAPAALLFALVTAGFTEEFFFRGVMQRALSAHLGSEVRAVLGTSILFSLYHVPYAYMGSFWPSHGDVIQAVQLAFTNGMLGGIVLGWLFTRAPDSLVPCILVHAAVDWIPAMGLMAHTKVHI